MELQVRQRRFVVETSSDELARLFRSRVPVLQALPAYSLRVEDLDEAEARLAALMDGMR
jgi:hypothetical protein